MRPRAQWQIGMNDATERRVESVHFMAFPSLRNRFFGRLPDLFKLPYHPHIRLCELI